MTTYSFNGAAWGAGTTARVTDVTGLDTPPMRTSDSPVPGRDGALGGIDLLDARSIEFELTFVESSRATLLAALLDLSAALARRSDDLPLSFQADPSLPVMRVNCRPRRRNVPMPNPNLDGYVLATLQLVANDPLIYSDAEHAVATGAPTVSGGFTFTFTFPFNFGTIGSGGVVAVSNVGTAPAPWIAIVQGPCVGVTIADHFGGRVRWDGTLAAGEVLTIDSHPARHTAVIGGTASRFGLIAADSTWFDLLPGSNEIFFSTDNGAGALTFSWRDAWWSLT